MKNATNTPVYKKAFSFVAAIFVFASMLIAGCSKEPEQAKSVNIVPNALVGSQPIPNTPEARKQLRETGTYDPKKDPTNNTQK